MCQRATTLALALIAALLLVACGGSAAEPEPRTDGAAAQTAAPSAPASTGEAEPLLAAGERVVFIGDSLGLQAPPNYPDLLPGELGERAPGVETVNLSESGTTTADWAPGSPLFEERLGPELDDADVVAVTLGGNDLQETLGAGDGLDALAAGPDAAADALRGIERSGRRLGRIFDEIRSRAPSARVVYVGYPDYSEATAWRERGGTLAIAALSLGLSALVDAAADADPDLLIDMREPTARAGVDSLLADSEHLSVAGHELYARRLAAQLTR
ncbi:MAG TPA: SGNH/GDSL hydrolase family protein [Solirubrobacterales bacterium]|nr:SGNH/GDSL hydrolase family protein [Solirubrobacterales bacterium]